MPRLATELRSPQVPQCWLEERLKKGQSHRNTLYNQLRLIHIDRDCQPNIEASIGVAPEGKSDASHVGIQHMPEPLTTRNCVRRWWKNFTRDVGDKYPSTSRKCGNGAKRNTTQWQTRLVPQKHTADAAAKKWCSRKTPARQLSHKKLCKKKKTQAVLSRCEMR